MTLNFDEIFTSKNVSLLLGGIVAGAAAVTLLQNDRVRGALATGISETMKMRDSIQAVTAAIKEDADDKYAQKVAAEQAAELKPAEVIVDA